MNTNILKLLAPLALLAGCAKTSVPEYSWTTDPDAVIVRASVGALTRTNPAGTAEEQTKFVAKDEIAISDGAKTVTYKYLDDAWTPEPASDYLVWKAPVTYKAWYPASSKDGFTLPTDQRESNGSQATVGNFAKADFMTGEYVCDSRERIPSDHKLKLTMNRRMALVTVNVDANRLNDEFAGKEIYIIRVESIQSGHSIVSSDGTGSGDAVDVMPYPYDRGWDNYQKKGEYHAIVVPCAGDDKARFLEITVGWKSASDSATGETKTFYYTGRPAFEAGKRYTYNLTIGKNKVELGDVTVADWGDNVDLGGGNDEYEADRI